MATVMISNGLKSKRAITRIGRDIFVEEYAEATGSDRLGHRLELVASVRFHANEVPALVEALKRSVEDANVEMVQVPRMLVERVEYGKQ